MKEKKHYIPPVLTVATCRAERGYAGSGTFGTPIPGLLELLLTENNIQYHETEIFSTHGSWQEDNDNFWL